MRRYSVLLAVMVCVAFATKTTQAAVVFSFTPPANVTYTPSGGQFTLFIESNSGPATDFLGNNLGGIQLNLLFNNFTNFPVNQLTINSIVSAPGFTVQGPPFSDLVGSPFAAPTVINTSFTVDAALGTSLPAKVALATYTFSGPANAFPPGQFFSVTVALNDDGDGSSNDAFETQANSKAGLPVGVELLGGVTYGRAVAIPEPSSVIACLALVGVVAVRRRLKKRA